MPTVRDPAVLKAVYLETARLVHERSIPTEILSAPRTDLFATSAAPTMSTSAPTVFLPKRLANQALVVRDSGGTNRFSGAPGLVERLRDCRVAFHCSTEQQAQINELAAPCAQRGKR